LQQHGSPSRTLAGQGQRSSGPLQRSNELSADPTRHGERLRPWRRSREDRKNPRRDAAGGVGRTGRQEAIGRAVPPKPFGSSTYTGATMCVSVVRIPGSPWISVRTTSARVGSSATSTNAKMSGWPQQAWAASPRPSSGGRQRPPGSSRPRPIQGHTPRPSGIPLLVGVAHNQRKRWHVKRLGGARSGRWVRAPAPSGATVRRRTLGFQRSPAGAPPPAHQELWGPRRREVWCWPLMRHPGASRGGSWWAACPP
jgi:hypothetical protein